MCMIGALSSLKQAFEVMYDYIINSDDLGSKGFWRSGFYGLFLLVAGRLLAHLINCRNRDMQ